MATQPEPNRSPDPNRSSELLELYKLAVEMADRVSARRGTANTYFLSVQTALVTLIGFGIPKLSESPWWVPTAVALAGLTLSGAWWMQLRSYRDLNAAKFTVINGLEEQLAARIYTDEWDTLRNASRSGRWRKHYTELGTTERAVPIVFAAAHVILLTGSLVTGTLAP
ncbi:RipA family octameric membrane protein [Streptomyces novaecaesareae]|uniref:RipA family octameric membrane protein n=1 Tax=Streptomyces novaecaesareae TaxID=68244 RepID=UPI0004AA5833|nr:hypothetical protein [Streptomyces novaecaesareae]